MAERLRRTLCVVGLVTGVALVVQFVVPFNTVPFSRLLGLRSFPVREPYLLFALAGWLAMLAAGVSLSVGAVGELLQKPWARRVLTTYLWLWVAAFVAEVVAQALFTRQLFPLLPGARGAAAWGRMLGGLVPFLLESAYPALLAVCLRWPELRPPPPPAGGFAPVVRAAE